MFLSTLVGIAIDEGFMGRVTDPVTQYVPEHAERDRRFESITLRDVIRTSVRGAGSPGAVGR